MQNTRYEETDYGKGLHQAFRILFSVADGTGVKTLAFGLGK